MKDEPENKSAIPLFLKALKLVGISLAFFVVLLAILHAYQLTQFEESSTGEGIKSYRIFGRLKEDREGISTNEVVISEFFWHGPDGLDPIAAFNLGDTNLMTRVCAKHTGGLSFTTIEVKVPAVLIRPLIPSELKSTLGPAGYRRGDALPQPHKAPIRDPFSGALGYPLLDGPTFGMDAFWLSYNDRYFRIQQWGGGSQQAANVDIVYSVDDGPAGPTITIHRNSLRWFNAD